MDVQFKVFAHLDGGKPEVRRFTIDRSVVTSYQYLAAKLEDIFPVLRRKAYVITWKDEDGDNVRISSDDELVIALNTGELNRLYVSLVEPEPQPPTVEIDMAFVPPQAWASDAEAGDEEAGLHVGVVCDACEGAVRGFRYRCTACPDYDLCAACEATGAHKQHCMLRIPVPLTPQHVRGKMRRSRHARLLRDGPCAERAADAAECPFVKKQRRDKSGDRRHHGRHHRSRGSWLETVATYLNEFANLAGDVGTGFAPSQAPPMFQTETPPNSQGNASATSQANAPTTSKANAPTTSKANAPTTSKSNAPSTSQTNATAATEQAKSSEATNAENGEAIPPPTGAAPCNTPDDSDPQVELAKLLAPFCQKNRELMHMLQTQHATAIASKFATLASTLARTAVSVSASASASTSASTENASTEHASMQTEFASAHAASQTPSEQGDVHMPEQSPDRQEGWTMINDHDSDLMDTPVPAATPSAPAAPAAPAQPIGFKDLPRTFDDKLRINEPQGLYPNISGASYAAQSGQAIPLPAPGQATPQLRPQPIPRTRHPKPHIEAALTQMLAMGFTDEGGWLTQLIENKEGNISAVLDLLSPVQVKRT